MNRSFRPPAREAVFAALVLGAACAPNNSVKPGAPELIEFTIVQPNPAGFPPFIPTTVKPDTPECVSGIAGGMACLPMGKMADAADGGTVTVDIPADGLCWDANATNWCSCIAGADPTMGSWSCEPFTNVIGVIAVFDRLLDTAPFDMVDAGSITNEIVTTSASGGAPVVDLSTDYSSTGAGNGLVFNFYGPFFGNLRADGPSLVSQPLPEFPSGATVTVALNANMVHAKDGTTPFTGQGLLSSGLLLFKMAPFSASVSPPADATMDPSVTIAFTNMAEPAPCPATDPMDATKTIACVTEPHISATSNGAPIAIAVESGGGAYVTVKPAADTWPAGATIVVTVDATTKNLLGQTVDAAATGMFTAP